MGNGAAQTTRAGNEAHTTSEARTADAVIIGGGVIGLAVARELASSGLRRIIIVERGRAGAGASHAAAGMLAPQAEANRQDAFFELAHESRKMYRRFADDLLAETGIDVELDETGTLYLAFTEEEEKQLARRFGWQRAANLRVESLTPNEARRREPHLSAKLRAALLFPDDAQVENRRLTHALAAACAAQRTIEVRANTEVVAIETDAGGREVCGVITSRGRIETRCVIIAGGAWSSQLKIVCGETAATNLLASPCPAAASFAIEPVRGQMLCFEASPPIVRHVVYSPRAYLVPRRDGRLLLGATTEHAGFDARTTAAGISLLETGGREITEHIKALPLREAWAGLRPRAADGLPVIGRSTHTAGVILATGHYRNGILLAPLTARLISEIVTSNETPELLRPFSPDRFAASEQRADRRADSR